MQNWSFGNGASGEQEPAALSFQIDAFSAFRPGVMYCSPEFTARRITGERYSFPREKNKARSLSERNEGRADWWNLACFCCVKGESGTEMPQKKYPRPIIFRRLIVRFYSAGVIVIAVGFFFVCVDNGRWKKLFKFNLLLWMITYNFTIFKLNILLMCICCTRAMQWCRPTLCSSSSSSLVVGV